MPASRIFCLARTSRWASVGSGTRKARAISGVVRPPSVRSVSATARLRRERRVAAREDQPQLVVGDRMHLVLRRHEHRRGRAIGVERRVARDDLGLVCEPPRPPDPVDRPVAGRRRDPRPRVVGDPVDRPVLERHHVRVGDRLLREVEVAQDPDEGRERPAVVLAEGEGDGVVGVGRVGGAAQTSSWIGLTSTVPIRAPGIRAAASIAASRSGASTR